MSSPRASWECIRCHKINAPHQDQCNCPPSLLYKPLPAWQPDPVFLPPFDSRKLWGVPLDFDLSKGPFDDPVLRVGRFYGGWWSGSVYPVVS